MTLVVLCLAAVAIIAAVVSLSTAAGLRVFRQKLKQLSPSALSRVYLCAASLPFVVSSAVLVTALAPSFGWIGDHCVPFGDPHLHPHICADHHVATWPAVSLTVLALALVVRVTVSLMGRARALWVGERARRTLRRASVLDAELGVFVLPFEQPLAFVFGLIRPTLYVTQGLVTGGARDHLPAVIAHERAHIERRDPLRRFIGGIGLSFHVPGIARSIGRSQSTAQEMAADDLAAQAVGSRRRVARALVALCRARCRLPNACAFSESDVEERVNQLLRARRQGDCLSVSTLGIAAAVAAVALAAEAGPVHHGVELLLGLLGN